MTAEPNPRDSGHERVLIVDFGSQVTQLIARRVRETGVYCEIHPFDKVTPERITALGAKSARLSGVTLSNGWISQ